MRFDIRPSPRQKPATQSPDRVTRSLDSQKVTLAPLSKICSAPEAVRRGLLAHGRLITDGMGLSMRFFRDGPDIPDDLLNLRDDGKVVFMCGAGVSQADGILGFVDLTKRVIDYFNPQTGSEIREAFRPWLCGRHESPKTPLDRIYDLLYDEYGEAEVRRLVDENLSADESARNDSHRLLLRISSDKKGKPQIVTTNFDRMFERGQSFSKEDVAFYPKLPGIRRNSPVASITYLHGKPKEPEEDGAADDDGHGYILSGTDFGRAYLADGQTTRFVRGLIESSYTVVFIGYSAEDPLVGYLLQGLNKHNVDNPSSGLYAFDKGAHADLETKWLRRGVTAIAYDNHHLLWKTIKAWAERADNPDRWKRKIVKMAQQGPRDMESHERSQVTHIISTGDGARLFAEADPPSPAEWLHVFDVVCRIPRAQPQTNGRQELEYNLDGERLPSTEDATLYPNFLGWQPGVGAPAASLCLERFVPGCFGRLPSNLNYLMQWIGRSMDQPTAAQWVAKKRCVHPKLINLLESGLDSGLRPSVREEWSKIIAFHKRRPYRGDASDEAVCLVDDSKWTGGTLEEPGPSWADLSKKLPIRNSGDPSPLSAEQIRNLTYESIRGSRIEIADWIERNFKDMFPDEECLAWDAFDHLVGGLMSDGGSATASGQGKSYVAGQVAHRKDHVGKARNGPIGKAASGCLDALKASCRRQQSFLDNAKPRIERLLDSPGAGREHAVTIISYALNDLCDIDPDWTKAWLVPTLGFDGRTAHAAWGGYLCGGNGLPGTQRNTSADQLFSKLKPCFMRFVSSLNGMDLHHDTEKMIAKVVICRYMRREGRPDGFTGNEIRDILRSVSDSGRRQAVSFLRCIGKDGYDSWINRVAPFIRDVWPRDVRCKTTALLSSWVGLLCITGDAFPAIYENLRPFLLRPDRLPPRFSTFLRKMVRKDMRASVSQHPDAYLDFLDRVVPDDLNDYNIPDELAEALELIKSSNKSRVDEKPFVRLSRLARRRHCHMARIMAKAKAGLGPK